MSDGIVSDRSGSTAVQPSVPRTSHDVVPLHVVVRQVLDTLVCAKGRDQVLGTEALVVLRACCVPLITRCLLLVQFPDFPERQGWAKSGSIGTNQRIVEGLGQLLGLFSTGCVK